MEPYPTTTAFKLDTGPSAHSRDMCDLLDKQLFTDVAFVVEGQEVRAHRAILATRSEHFRAMFTSGMSESHTDAPIAVHDCKHRTFRALLTYLYSDLVSLTDTTEIAELLALAHLYLLDELRLRCDRLLACRRFDASEVVDMLSFAHTYNAPDLKKACIAAVLARHGDLDLSRLDKDLIIDMLRISCSNAAPSLKKTAECGTHFVFDPPKPTAGSLFGFATPGTKPFRLIE